jgi:hypothetical protein
MPTLPTNNFSNPTTMGRVARYKKVKRSLTTNGGGGGDYLDTVGVWGMGDSGRKAKKRSQTALKLRARRNKPAVSDHDVFDVAPAGDDFDLSDIVGSVKREANPLTEVQTSTAAASMAIPKLLTNTVNEPAVPVVDDTTAATLSPPAIDEEQEILLKKFEKQVAPPPPVVAAEARMPGESKRAYNKRVKLETRQIIQRANKQAHNSEKRQKKKDFLNQKKKRHRSNTVLDNQRDDHDECRETSLPSDKLWTGEQAVAERARATQVQFGEQAERPPTFGHLPRGAKRKQPAPHSVTTHGNKGSSREAANVEAEHQQAMDLMRRKVQAQYAAIKLRRKQSGDFHL